MIRRPIQRIGLGVALVLLWGAFHAPVLAQAPVVATELRVTSTAPVLETPRGDGFVLDTVDPGTRLEVLEQNRLWYLVRTPDNSNTWREGWVRDRYVEVIGTREIPPEEQPVTLRTSLRGFVQFSGMWFTASDSFDAITGSSLGVMYGGGGGVGFSNGFFVQGGVERYEDTGQRVFIANNQIFELGIPNTIEVMPIQATAGYRQVSGSSVVGYIGGGAGVYLYKETGDFGSPADNIDEKYASYHILGGVEVPLLSWLWLGGEGQYTWVPSSIGEEGISAEFDETDLGGFALRVKLSVGY